MFDLELEIDFLGVVEAPVTLSFGWGQPLFFFPPHVFVPDVVQGISFQ
ncbi:MAG: hypothetical protein HW380_451 [Magnetococcales bacterium]|nr:hypothetical protein [Magnetococcales bacterium]